MKSFILIAAAAAMATGSPVFAAPCKDAAGKIVKCPAKTAARKACKPTKTKPCGKYRTKVQNPAGQVGYKW